MKPAALLLVVVCTPPAFPVPAPKRDAPATNAELIVGRWEKTLANGKPAEPFVVEYDANEDGRTYCGTAGDKSLACTWTYTVKGEVIHFVQRDTEYDYSIKFISKDRLVVAGDGDEFEYTRK